MQIEFASPLQLCIFITEFNMSFSSPMDKHLYLNIIYSFYLLCARTHIKISAEI